MGPKGHIPHQFTGVRLPNEQTILEPPCLAPPQAPQVCRAPAVSEVQALCSPPRCYREQRQECSALALRVSYKTGLREPKGQKESCMCFSMYGQSTVRSPCLGLMVQCVRLTSPGLCQVSRRELCPTRWIPSVTGQFPKIKLLCTHLTRSL